jgi:hypothetical protein
VHIASTGAEAMPKMVSERPTMRGGSFGDDFVFHVKHENPDGSIVSSSVLRGAVGLYLTPPPRRARGQRSTGGAASDGYFKPI